MHYVGVALVYYRSGFWLAAFIVSADDDDGDDDDALIT